eukprot:7630564-Heterocapsa_arctica.AAC.1
MGPCNGIPDRNGGPRWSPRWAPRKDRGGTAQMKPRLLSLKQIRGPFVVRRWSPPAGVICGATCG